MKRICLLILLALLTFKSSFSQITLVQFATGFSEPVDIKNCGDNRLFVVERAGRIRIVDTAGVLRPGYFLDIHTIVESGYNEQGLLGLAFSPDYKTSGQFYCYYTQKTTNRVRVSRFNVSGTNPDSAVASSEQVLLDIFHWSLNHDGGHLAFGPDGYLYVGTGDGGGARDPGNRSQNLDSLLGKMLRIDVSGGGAYSIPSTNPYVCKYGRDEIWARGLRNPWRWSFDRWTGDLWIGDVGQDTWEEVDYQSAGIPGGRNYGWRCYEGFVHTPSVTVCSPSDTTGPVHVISQATTTSCAVIGGYVYRGAKYSNLFGKYFFTDECMKNIKYLQPNGSGGFSVTDLGALTTNTTNDAFGEDMWGELYLSDLNGRIFKFQGQSCSPTAFLSTEDTVFACGNSVTLRTPAGQNFHYSWHGPASFGDTSAIQVTQPGDYYVTVFDQNFCSSLSDTVHVSFVSPPVVDYAVLDPNYCIYDPTVTLTPSPAGGTFYGCGMFGNQFYPDSTGGGLITVTYVYTDEHGCTNSIAKQTLVDVCTGIEKKSFVNVSLFPNPNSGSFSLSFYMQYDKLVTLQVTDVLGRAVYNEEVHVNVGTHKMDLHLPGVAKGAYALKVSDDKGSLVKNFVIQ